MTPPPDDQQPDQNLTPEQRERVRRPDTHNSKESEWVEWITRKLGIAADELRSATQAAAAEQAAERTRELIEQRRAQMNAALNPRPASTPAPDEDMTGLMVLPAWTMQAAARYALITDRLDISVQTTRLIEDRWPTTSRITRAAIRADIIAIITEHDKQETHLETVAIWRALLHRIRL